MAKTAANSRPLARRPDNSAFKQQRLPAWSPMLTGGTVLPFFFFMGVLCILLGVWLLLTVQGTYEIKVDYTEAGTCDRCYELRNLSKKAHEPCTCRVNFSLKENFTGDVFFYYGLVNFHQNLRRYMDSRDDGQMVGRLKNLKVQSHPHPHPRMQLDSNNDCICYPVQKSKLHSATLANKLLLSSVLVISSNQSPSSYCHPFIHVNKTPIAPCGAIANSMFNDSFTLNYHSAVGKAEAVPLYRKGIAWYTDKNVKFRNPSMPNKTLPQVFEGTVQPLYWQKPVYQLDPSDPNNNGFVNEDLIVWMREAAFPKFKKLYGILNRNHPVFRDGLPAGDYNYPAQYFQGRKQVVLSTVTWFGGQNHFLPIAYMVTGGLVLLLAVVLTVVYVKVGKGRMNLPD
ncbi:hypothetical protein JZ751_023584 [Albula glossodonta]|uniref:Cell cycle control protein n=1 Tax=Albula glossodonta TaxID=121402 RepID=A0A8T2NSX0_9TELE|nr:hypothetical protein JZ751_023584 [Albula glossodonta]